MDKKYSQFLRERGLAGSYRAWSRLKSKKKRIITVHQKKIDGTVRRRKVYVLKENNKTYFRDFQTMKVLATTKKKIPSALASLSKTKTIKGTIKARDWKVTKNIETPILRLKNIQDKYFLKDDIERRHRVSTRPSRNNGHVILDVTYKAMDGSRKRVQIKSGNGYLMDTRIRNKLVREAVENGSRLAGFSPVEVVINGIWYEWITDRRL